MLDISIIWLIITIIVVPMVLLANYKWELFHEGFYVYNNNGNENWLLTNCKSKVWYNAPIGVLEPTSRQILTNTYLLILTGVR